MRAVVNKLAVIGGGRNSSVDEITCEVRLAGATYTDCCGNAEGGSVDAEFVPFREIVEVEDEVATVARGAEHKRIAPPPPVRRWTPFPPITVSLPLPRDTR